MFLRQYHRTKDGTRHTYFALVEAQRTARGPRQRIVAPLGELTRDQQRCWQRTALEDLLGVADGAVGVHLPV